MNVKIMLHFVTKRYMDITTTCSYVQVVNVCISVNDLDYIFQEYFHYWSLIKKKADELGVTPQEVDMAI